VRTRPTSPSGSSSGPPGRLNAVAVDDLRASDVVIKMGCGDACPVLPGKRYEDWELPDPTGLSLEEVRPIRDTIRTRVEALLDTVAR